MKNKDVNQLVTEKYVDIMAEEEEPSQSVQQANDHPYEWDEDEHSVIRSIN